MLRKFEITDADSIFLNWAKDPKNVKYLVWSAHKNISETKEIINIWLKEYRAMSSGNWCITLLPSNEAIGSITAIPDKENAQCCKIGYVLSKKHWRKGIMTEALTAVLNHIFENSKIKKVQAWHDIDNPASGKVMKKSGMKRMGILKSFAKRNTGELSDAVIYSICKNEFENKKIRNSQTNSESTDC